MVLISSTKYACETCIKGHRSSTCKHTDRPLFEIKKKGRPVTQCEHCRELRKTKQVHVKCVCEVHDDATPKSLSCSKKKASFKALESAAFPHGLPQGLEASVAMQPHPEGLPSESDHNPSCSCKTDGICHCFTPRKSAPRRRRKTISDLRHDYDSSHDVSSRLWNPNLPLASMSSSSLSHVLARIAELRPVLPKPSTAGPCHDPSSGVAHSHSDRHHTYENMFFSPYGRAYEVTHGSQHRHVHGHSSQPSVDSSASVLLNEDNYAEQITTLPIWSSATESTSFPSACNCGDSCSCPGCIQHNGTATSSTPMGEAFNTCANPGTCNACLDCTIMSLPASLSLDTASLYDSEPSQFIDEWVRQVSDIPTSQSSASEFDGSVAVNLEPAYVQPPWETYQLPDNPEIEQVPDVLPSDNTISCVCPPDMCICERSKDDDCAQLLASGGLAFMSLGRRMLCQTTSPLDAPVFTDVPDGNENVLVPSLQNGFLTAPQLQRSRSSSGSSYSSPNFEQFLSSDDVSGFQIPSIDYFSNGLPVMSSQPSFSPTHSEHDGRSIYPVSNPDSDGSYEDQYSQYDPLLDDVPQYRESYTDGLE